MPNCFTLTRKGEDTPATLQSVDEEICKYLGVPVDEKHYCYGWYDSIGLNLAMGKSFDKIIGKIKEYMAEATELDNYDFEKQLLKIAEFLKENYVSDAFYQRRT